ncbi:MAG: hypothetical protein DRN66_01240 [Candidatus Nanohalarchaeota archaeon]|nr:MAG: hypothetical protein DRN66_01240 [Candidatus Nanohaloarchaeota archaeon]
MAERVEEKSELEEFNEDFIEDDPLTEEEHFDDEIKSESLADIPPAREEKVISKAASVPPKPVEEQEKPYSRLGGPLFISVPKYRDVGKRIYSMKSKVSKLKNELAQIKDLRSKSTKTLSDVLDDLESVEENIREINGVLKVKS